MRELAQNLAALFAISVSLLLLAALAAFVAAVVRELRRNTVFLEPINVPRGLATRGYSPPVVAERLLDALHGLQRESPPQKELRSSDPMAPQVGLLMPERFSLRVLAQHVHRMLRAREPRIGGEITREGKEYELTLRRHDERGANIVGVRRSGELPDLLAQGAEELMRITDPWMLAHHYFALETRKRPPEFARTLATLDHMLQHAPPTDRPWVLNLQGVCLLQQRQPLPAIERFREAAAAAPRLAFIHQNWAAALDQVGRFDEARSHRIRALEIPAQTTDLIAGSAINAAQLHRNAQALKLARRALSLAPRHPHAWSAWGRVLFGLHRLDQAATACERAVALGARDALWSPPLAMVYAALGRPDKALSVAHHEIERTGENEETLKAMGFARLAAGDAHGAVASFDAALADAPGSGDAAYGRADALFALGDHELALAYYTRAVAIDPFYPQAHEGWAQALRALGRLEEAPPRFAVAVRVDAAYAPAYRGWAEALTALGRGAEAGPLIAQADAVERRNREPLPLR